MSSSTQHSNDANDLRSTTSMNNSKSIGFAPLHRTVELENLPDSINSIQDKQTTSTKKILTKCMTVIGDGSDKQI